MAAVSGWSEVQKDLAATKLQLLEVPVCAYSPVKQTMSMTQDCFGGMADRLSEFLKNKTSQRGVGDATHLAVTLESITKSLETYTAVLMDLAKRLPPEATEKKSEGKKPEQLIVIKDVPLQLGLDAREQVECVRKAQEIAIAWFTQQCQDFSGRKVWQVSIAKIFDRTWYLDPEMHRFFYRQFKMISSKEPFAFTAADRAAFGIKEGEKIADPLKIQCMAFALLKTRELRATEYIFHGKEFTKKDLLQTLKAWGYVPVETPTPNDLVMYVDSEGNPTHLGRFLSSGKVESKLGINMPYFHWHNIFDVPAFYGNRVVFMHKV